MTSEKEFLKAYKNSGFPVPLLTVDSVLFSVKDASLKILLLKRANHPHKSQWSLPGGFIDIDNDNTTRDTAIRKLTEKTQVTPPYLEQLRSFSGKTRDPRGWSTTIAYFALIAYKEANIILQHADDAQWISLDKLSDYQPLAFDHQEIIQVATERLRQKALYSMLPE